MSRNLLCNCRERVTHIFQRILSYQQDTGLYINVELDVKEATSRDQQYLSMMSLTMSTIHIICSLALINDGASHGKSNEMMKGLPSEVGRRCLESDGSGRKKREAKSLQLDNMQQNSSLPLFRKHVFPTPVA